MYQKISSNIASDNLFCEIQLSLFSAIYTSGVYTEASSATLNEP